MSDENPDFSRKKVSSGRHLPPQSLDMDTGKQSDCFVMRPRSRSRQWSMGRGSEGRLGRFFDGSHGSVSVDPRWYFAHRQTRLVLSEIKVHLDY